MRLFLALELPSDIKKELNQIITRKNISGKINSLEKMHVTLIFFGDKKQEEIIEKLQNFSFKKFKVTLNGQSAIPYINGFNIISPELITLMSQLHELFDIPAGDLKPHVTLSRIKSKQEKVTLNESFSFNAQKIVLINSVPSANGYDYTIVKEFTALK